MMKQISYVKYESQFIEGTIDTYLLRQDGVWDEWKYTYEQAVVQILKNC